MQIVVIGAGLTGLSAAILCAKLKQQVTLIEAKDHLAPLISGFWRNNLYFDTGFHAAGGLEEGGLLNLWLKALGLFEDIAANNCEPLSETFYIQGEAPLIFPKDKKYRLKILAKRFGQDAVAKFQALEEKIKETLAKSPYTNPKVTTDPHLNWQDTESLAQVFTDLALPPLMRSWLSSLCLLYGTSQESANFLDFALVAGPYLASTSHILGGGAKILQTFQKALSKTSVAIRLNAKACAIRHTDQGVSAIELTTGETLTANACIFTGHPKQLATLVQPQVLRKAYLTHIQSLKETPYPLIIFASSKSHLLAQRTIYLLPNLQTSTLNPIGAKDPTVHLSGGAGNSGRYPIIAISPCEHPSPTLDYQAWKDQEARRLTAYIEERLPSLAPLKIEAVATEATLRHFVYGTTGSTYGIAHDQTNLPLLPVTRLKNLFLAGQNVLLPGLLGSIISAALAAGFLFGHDVVLQEFRRCAPKD